MADVAPNPAPAKKSGGNKLHAIGKLTALLGLPVLIIGSLFGGGLWYGATHSYRISSLEARYLGLSAPEGATWTPPGGLSVVEDEDAASGETGAEAAAGETGGEAAAGETGAEASEGPSGPEPKPETPADANPDPPPASAELVAGLPVAEADPVGPELRAQVDASLVVRVKLLVDPAVAIAREDWLAYVAGGFAASDASFETLFGVELRLQGVVLWDAAPGADPQALLADLRQRDHEGADVVLGVLARPAPPSFRPQAWTGEVHGDHGLVFADLERDDRYYQNLLRTLATLLGAESSDDESAAQLGSFMSASGTPDGQPPALDPVNRGQVLIHKRRPFAADADAPGGGGQDEPGEGAASGKADEHGEDASEGDGSQEEI